MLPVPGSSESFCSSILVAASLIDMTLVPANVDGTVLRSTVCPSPWVGADSTGSNAWSGSTGVGGEGGTRGVMLDGVGRSGSV